VSDPPVHPAVATAAGAVLAGVVGGTASALAGAAYGLVVGVAIAMPVFFQFGYGVGNLSRGRYYEDRDRRGLATDAAATMVGALALGAGVAAVAQALELPQGVAIGAAMGAAFFAGGTVFLLRTSEFQGGD